MVVSVDISGTLEERLRRLVDLGIYASVSEAVRDALRRLMDELDLNKIALTLYTQSEPTLSYLCEFTGTPCNKLITYMIENGVVPLLGAKSQPTSNDIPERLVISPTALFVLYNSYLSDLLWKLREEGVRLYIAEQLVRSQQLWEAYSIHKGLLRHILNIEVLQPCARKKNIKINNKIIISTLEKETLAVAMTCGLHILTIDQRFESLLRSTGIRYTGAIDILYEARRRGLISGMEAIDIALSMKAVPVLFPTSFLQDLR